MKDKFSSAVTLGYAVLFIALWLFAMPAAGWTTADPAQVVLPIQIILGGVILTIAGIFCFFNEAKIDSVIFFIVGTFVLSYSLRFLWFPNLKANTNPSTLDGWILVLLAVVIFYLWLASFKDNPIKQFFLLSLWISLLAFGLANWLASIAIGYVGGYAGLITALLAGWYSASTILSKKGDNTQQTE